MLQQIKTALKNYIKQSFLSLIFDDSQLYPQGQYTNNDISGKFTRMSVYGICSSPPKGAHILLINAQGQESVKFGFVNDFINRKKNLKEGEVALYNSETKSIVWLKEDESILIGNENLPFTSTPSSSTGLELLELINRILIVLQGVTNLAGSASTVSFLPTVLTELGKIQADLNSMKGTF